MQRSLAVAGALAATLGLALLGLHEPETARRSAPADVSRAAPASTAPASRDPAAETGQAPETSPSSAASTSATTSPSSTSTNASPASTSSAANAPVSVGETIAPRADARSLDQFLGDEVEKIAGPLAFDGATKARVIQLTRTAYLDLMAEIRERTLGHAAADESTDELIARRTGELHARILATLGAEQRVRYRELLGLEKS